jgi:aminoglycoside phosphotransferase (APT) family kinase protein
LADTTWPEREALAHWMAQAIPDGAGLHVDDVQRLEAGYSADTVSFTVRRRRGGDETAERFVLRGETDEPAVYPQQAPGLDVEIAVQYQAMREIAARSSVPVAPLVGFEGDPAVLGRPFFVMGFVDGQVPRVQPPYTKAGFYFDAEPGQRRGMVAEALRRLAEIHAIDWQDGFGWLVPSDAEPGTAHQLALWESYTRRELGERTHPIVDRALAWLHANMPAGEPTTLTWGDARLGNIIWRDFQCACITDFENAAICSPVQDVGWWLMFDRWSHDGYDAPRLAGEPTRDEQRALYSEFVGRDVGDTTFHEVFAAFRYSAIVVRVMNRRVVRGDASAEQTVWLDNPTSRLLSTMLDELGAAP